MKKLTKRTIPFVLVLVFALSVLLALPAGALSHGTVYKNTASVILVAEDRNVFISTWYETIKFNNTTGAVEYGYQDPLLGSKTDCVRVNHPTIKHWGNVASPGHGAVNTEYGQSGSWTNKATVKHESGTIQWMGLTC